MRIKRITAIVLSAITVLSLAACKKTDVAESTVENEVLPVEEITGTHTYETGLCINDPKFYTGDVVNVNLIQYYNFSALSDDGSLSEQYDSGGAKLLKIAQNYENKEIIYSSFTNDGTSYGIAIKYLTKDEAILRVCGKEVTLPPTDNYTELRFDFTADEYSPVLETAKLISPLYISKIILYRPVTELESSLSGDAVKVSCKFADTKSASEYGIISKAGENNKLTVETAEDVKTFTEKNFSAEIDLSAGAVSVRGYAKYPDGSIAYSSVSTYTKEQLEKRAEYKEKTETYSLTDDSVYENVVVLGRHERVKNGVTFDYTCATLRFKAECMGTVTAKIHNDKAHKEIYTVLIDGKRLPIRYELNFEEAAEKTLTFDIGNRFCEHEIEICRATERAYGSAELESFTIHGTLKKAEKREKLIEFLGDSITAGTADYRYFDIEKQQRYSDDGSMAYAFLTAEELGCDYRMVAHSGYGFMISSAGEKGLGHTWDAEYELQNYYRDENKVCNFAEQPDIVCIYLGTNDVSQSGDLTTRTAGAKNMFSLVRKNNPNAKIVWIIGGMSTAYGDAVRMAAAELGDEKNGYYTFRLDGAFHSAGMYHPSVAEHKEMARQLSEFLSLLL